MRLRPLPGHDNHSPRPNRVGFGLESTKYSGHVQAHLGLCFNDPKLAFKLGCEPGAKTPTVTPFNGEQHAGIQVVNTANFPVNAGPLSRVTR